MASWLRGCTPAEEQRRPLAVSPSAEIARASRLRLFLWLLWYRSSSFPRPRAARSRANLRSHATQGRGAAGVGSPDCRGRE
eukprot:7067575-Pyramimonas_sp.AAC.1